MGVADQTGGSWRTLAYWEWLHRWGMGGAVWLMGRCSALAPAADLPSGALSGRADHCVPKFLAGGTGS